MRPLHNAKVAKRTYRVQLDGRRGTELRLEVAALAAGPLALAIEAQAKVGKESIPIKTKELDLVGVGVGALAGGVGAERAVLCSDSLLVVVSRTRGSVEVYNRLRGYRYRRLFVPRPELGPPFSEDDLFQEKGDAIIEEAATGVAVRLRSASVSRPGMVLERCIRIDQRPLVQIVDRVANGGPRPLDIQRQQNWRLHQGKPGVEAQLCAPRPGGVVAHSWNWGGRDLHSIRIPEKGDQWPEGWLCLQGGEGATSAVLWKRAEIVGVGNWGHIKQDGGRIQAGETKAFAPIYGFVGDGTYQTVRGWWSRLFGGGVSAEGPDGAPPQPVLQLQLAPQPLLLQQGRGTAQLELRSAGTYKMSGRITLKVKGPVQLEPSAVDVKDLTCERPVDKRIQMKASAAKSSGPAAIELAFATDEAIYRGQAAALVLPAAPAPVVRQRQGDLISLDNGLLRAQIAPQFFASVVSLKRGRVEYLNSNYPKAGVRDWRNPWHGGIHPVCNRLWGTLHREDFRPRLIERRGAQGLKWTGVRLTSTLEQEDGRGQQLVLEYLLAPGVGMLAIVTRCLDVVGVSSYGNVGFNLWPAFGDRPGTAHFQRPNSAGPIGLAAPHWTENTNWDWGGLVGDNGRALFTCGHGDGERTGGWAGGDEGCGLFGEVSGSVAAGGGIEGLFFVGPYASAKAAEKGALWAEFDRLP